MTQSNGISRRNMIAVTGAGLALAGCNSAPKADKSADGPAMIGGFDPPYGDDPNPPAPQPTSVFAPLALTLVRIASTVDFGLDINYASVLPTDGGAFSADDKAREEIAAKWFKSVENGVKRKRFHELPDDTAQKLHTFRDGKRDVDNFENFGSNGQSEFYFWIDSPKVDFARRKKTDAADPGRPHLISFARFLAVDEPAKENKTFYARTVEGTGLPGLVMAVKNYFRDELGKPMTPGQSAVKHAMNLHFRARANGNLWIPMVIDPDTGNGVGYDP